MTDIAWAGLDNYQTLASDPVFWQALLHNVIFIGVGASTMVVLGLTLACSSSRVCADQTFFGGSSLSRP